MFVGNWPLRGPESAAAVGKFTVNEDVNGVPV